MSNVQVTQSVERHAWGELRDAMGLRILALFLVQRRVSDSSEQREMQPDLPFIKTLLDCLMGLKGINGKTN